MTQPHQRRAADQVQHALDGDGGHRAPGSIADLTYGSKLRLTVSRPGSLIVKMRRALLAACLLFGVGGGCGGAGGGVDGAGGGPGQTCQSIRLCALDCGDDACVMSTCKVRGDAAAQAAFQSLYDCTKTAGGCVPGNINCLCLAQCLESPPCASELDMCVGATTDSICDVSCH